MNKNCIQSFLSTDFNRETISSFITFCVVLQSSWFYFDMSTSKIDEH